MIIIFILQTKRHFKNLRCYNGKKLTLFLYIELSVQVAYIFSLKEKYAATFMRIPKMYDLLLKHTKFCCFTELFVSYFIFQCIIVETLVYGLKVALVHYILVKYFWISCIGLTFCIGTIYHGISCYEPHTLSYSFFLHIYA